MNNNSNFFETTDDVTSYYFSNLDDAKKLGIEPQAMPLPKNENNLGIYKLLEENCDLYFLKDFPNEEFSFKCSNQFLFFASDSNGCLYGVTTNDIPGDIGKPIAYISKDNQCVEYTLSAHKK